jgi:hypothetical protein
VVIELQGVPAGAVVTVNGQRMTAPLQLVRSEQARIVRVTAPGYQPFQRSIKPDRDQVIAVHMAKAATAAARAPVKPPAPAKPDKKKPDRILLSNPFK